MKEDKKAEEIKKYRVIVNGALGQMGKALIDGIAKSSIFTLAAGSDINGSGDIYTDIKQFDGEADVIIDFSHHSATKSIIDYAVLKKIPIVIATTGHSDDEKKYIHDSSKKIPVFYSGNMSLGIAVLKDALKYVVSRFPDAEIEIVEKHHDRKLDVPSGTALMLANAVKSVRPDATFNIGRHENGKRSAGEIGIHSLRMGNIVGEHEIIITTGTQSITLKHEAFDRRLFAEGALVAAEFLISKKPGLYDMDDVAAV